MSWLATKQDPVPSRESRRTKSSHRRGDVRRGGGRRATDRRRSVAAGRVAVLRFLLGSVLLVAWAERTRRRPGVTQAGGRSSGADPEGRGGGGRWRSTTC